MPSNNSYIWRAIRPEDIPSVRLVLAQGGGHLTEQKQALLQHISAESLVTDTWMALTSADEVAAIGYVLVLDTSEEEITCFVDGTVHPSHCRLGLGSQIFDWQVAHSIQKAQEMAREFLLLRGSCEPDNAGCNHLFEEYGFARLVTQCQMRFDLSQPILTKDFPDSTIIVPYSTDRDEELRHVFNQAFEGHWIENLSQEQWQDRFIRPVQFRPDLTNIAIIHEKVVGFYLTEVFEKDSGQAWLEILGVLPEWRGQGLGTALTIHALQTYKSAGFRNCLLGVDEENITKAKKIYDKLGFVQEKATRHFARKVKLFNS